MGAQAFGYSFFPVTFLAFLSLIQSKNNCHELLTDCIKYYLLISISESLVYLQWEPGNWKCHSSCVQSSLTVWWWWPWSWSNGRRKCFFSFFLFLSKNILLSVYYSNWCFVSICLPLSLPSLLSLLFLLSFSFWFCCSSVYFLYYFIFVVLFVSFF